MASQTPLQVPTFLVHYFQVRFSFLDDGLSTDKFLKVGINRLAKCDQEVELSFQSTSLTVTVLLVNDIQTKQINYQSITKSHQKILTFLILLR